MGGCYRKSPSRQAKEMMFGGIVMVSASVWFGLTKRDTFHEEYIHILVTCLIALLGVCFLAGGAFWYRKMLKQLENTPREAPPVVPPIQDASSRCPQYGVVTGPEGFNPPPPYPATASNFSYDNSGYGSPPPYPVAAFGAPPPQPGVPEDNPPPYSSAFTYTSNPVGDK